MDPQILPGSAVSVTREIQQVDIREKSGVEERSHETRTVIIIRWLSILFCLVFWYGIYSVVRLLLS